MATTRAADSAITNGTKYNTMSAGNYSPSYLSYLDTATHMYNDASAIDSAGNIYVYGNISSTVNTIQKYNKYGILIWQKTLTFGGPGGTAGSGGIVVAPNDASIYVSSDIPDVSQSVSDISVIKLNSSGVIQWQNRYEFGGAYDENSTLAIDSSENVYIVGDTTNGGYRSIWVKINSSGAIVGQYTYTEGNINFGCGSFIDSSNRVYATTFNSPTGAVYDTVLIRYGASPGGGQEWARKVGIGSNFNSPAMAISGTSGGDVYFACYPTTGTTYGVLFKYNTSGTLQWQRKWSTSFSVGASAVAVDSSGNAYVAANGDSKTYLIKYDSSGTIQWQRELSGSGGYIETTRIQIIDSNNIMLTGRVTGSTNYNDFTFSFPTDGSQIGVRPLGPITITYKASSLTDAAGSATATSPSFTLSTPTYVASSINKWTAADTTYTEYNTRLP
jgi:hypothetical protein